MLAQSRESFDAVPDFTVAVEEEFALLDPDTLGLVNRFEELQEAGRGTELEPHLVGELIASEIEVRTGRCGSFADAAALLGERRQQLRALVEPRGIALGATGTHPWSPWQEQRIIDTPHYRLNDAALGYALTARIARALDDGEPLPSLPHRLLEENLWRAIRYGLSGELIDFASGEPLPARARLERLVDWVRPVAEELGAAEWLAIPERNAAERQIARHDEGASAREIFEEQVRWHVRTPAS